MLKGQAFGRLRTLIEALVLTPDAGELTINLRGMLASMLSLCAGDRHKKAPEPMAAEALQMKLVAGPCRHFDLLTRCHC